VNRLVVAFLKSGVLAEAQFVRTEIGTPQGGILSPLLANIALSMIEERYQRHVWPSQTPTPQTDPEAIERRARDNRGNDKRRGKVVYVPIRYADDFLVLVSLPAGLTGESARAAVEYEKKKLAEVLKERLGLELSETKTLVTRVTSIMRFLGHHIRVRYHRAKRRKVCAIVVPKDRSQRLRALIKERLARTTVNSTLEERLLLVNPLLRGWCYFYRHAWGAKRVFTSMDHYAWWTILRWLRKKHPRAPMRQLAKQYGAKKPRGRMLRWQENGTGRFECARVRVGRYWLTRRPPAFATTPMESPVLNERGTPGSAEGAQKPHGVSRERR
jgi:hypothetical protein